MSLFNRLPHGDRYAKPGVIRGHPVCTSSKHQFSPSIAWEPANCIPVLVRTPLRFALGFVTGLIAGFFVTLVIWVRLTDDGRPFSHMSGMEGMAVGYLGLFGAAPLGGLILGLALGYFFHKTIP
jgi:hypothetical protein